MRRAWVRLTKLRTWLARGRARAAEIPQVPGPHGASPLSLFADGPTSVFPGRLSRSSQGTLPLGTAEMVLACRWRGVCETYCYRLRASAGATTSQYSHQ